MSQLHRAIVLSMCSGFNKKGIWWTAVGFFLIAMELGMWVPALGNVLDSRGVGWILPYAFAVGPLAALISPLIFGSMADYKFSAQKLLGVLSMGGAVFLALSFIAMDQGWSIWLYASSYILTSLFYAPMWSLLATVTLANIKDKKRNFPLIRVWGTVGWILGGVLVSFLSWDSSPMTGVAGAVVRFLLGLACFMMPDTPPLGIHKGERGQWKKYLGLGALVLFKEKSFRVFLITSMLFAVPLAAFYMYAPIQLKELGDTHPSASMTIGQVTEIIAMLLLASCLAQVRIRWLFVAALVMAVIRYTFFALAAWSDILWWMWLGVALQGPCYTFFYVTGQMLVDQKVPAEMRGQAQALLGVMVAGVGGLFGSLLCGWGYHLTEDFAAHWFIFWATLAFTIIIVTMYFWREYVRKLS